MSRLMIYSHGFRDLCGNKHVKANTRHELVRVAVLWIAHFVWFFFFGLLLALIMGLAQFSL